MRGLTLALAEQIADGALAKAREVGCERMTVAVVDAGGYLLVLKREDGSGNLRPDIALGTTCELPAPGPMAATAIGAWEDD